MRNISIMCMALMVLSGCASGFQARAVSYYDDGLELSGGKQFAVVAEAGQEHDLEFRHYAEMVNRHLHAKGLKQAATLAAADYRVLFRYHVDDGKTQIVSYPTRGYGGVGGYYGSGGAHGLGMGYSIPIYGNRLESYTRYQREFSLHILRNNASRAPVYQGKVMSTGSDNLFAAVAPCMIAALFQNFPGVNGQEVTVQLPPHAC